MKTYLINNIAEKISAYFRIQSLKMSTTLYNIYTLYAWLWTPFIWLYCAENHCQKRDRFLEYLWSGNAYYFSGGHLSPKCVFGDLIFSIDLERHFYRTVGSHMIWYWNLTPSVPSNVLQFQLQLHWNAELCAAIHFPVSGYLLVGECDFFLLYYRELKLKSCASCRSLFNRRLCRCRSPVYTLALCI
jgi:hypothetical protein